MRTIQRLIYPAVLALTLVLTSVGCGGGGGGSTRPDTSPPDSVPDSAEEAAPDTTSPGPPPDNTSDPADEDALEAFNMRVENLAEKHREDANFGQQWGLRTINADRAYAHLDIAGAGNPGSGVTIGFIDTGIDSDHPLFRETDNKIVTGRQIAGETSSSRFSHGTAVASIAAGTRLPDSPDMLHGVAWNARIAMFAISLGSGGGTYNPVSLGNIDSSGTSIFFNSVLAWRNQALDFLNLSFGARGIINGYSEQQIRTGLGQVLTTLAQADTTDKTILIWAAGNAHGDPCTATADWCINDRVNAYSVELYPGLAARIEELRGHTLAVVAINRSGTISSFSNRCGIAADYCLAAPGEAVQVAYSDPVTTIDPNCSTQNCEERRTFSRSTRAGNGTSYAAPMVSGALAVMKQLFRDQLSNTQLASRLLQTADKSGVYADQAIYGQGLLDLGAATAPVGTPTITLGNRVDNAGASLRTTHIQLGAAFGDALQQSFAGQQIAAFDALGAPFWFDLDHAAQNMPTPSMPTRLHHFLQPANTASARQRFGFMQNIIRTNAPGHLTLASYALGLGVAESDTVSVTAFTTEGMADRMPATGAALTWQPTHTPLNLRAGWLGERQSLLGSATDGAFGTLSADAVFVGVRTQAGLGRWQIGADAEIGTVKPAARGGIITDTSDLITSAFTLQADRKLDHDATLRLSLSQPLRVETGQASLTIPVGRTKTGNVIHKSISAGLTPSGRQLDLTAEWHRRLPVGELRLGVTWTHEPGHRATSDPELTLLTGWRLSY